MANNANETGNPRRDDAADRTTTHTVFSRKVSSAIISVVLIAALVVGTYALARLDTWGTPNGEVPDRFQLDLTEQIQVPAELLKYSERQKIDTGLQAPHALAVAADGTLWVAGDRAVVHLMPTGQTLCSVALDQEPTCLALGPASASGQPGRVYVGTGRRVFVFSESGEAVAQWPELGPKSQITALAATPHHVFIADAGQRIVLCCDQEGREQSRIGARDPERNMPGFIIPSPYFDLLTGADEIVWIVNPGVRRVESYSYDGQLQAMWGQAGSQLSDFFGCCNPAHLALLPDGRFITSEKGIPRVKIYSATGDFECVVAGAEELGVSAAALTDARGDQVERVFDVAGGPDGVVWVLDTQARTVRAFYPKLSAGDRA